MFKLQDGIQVDKFYPPTDWLDNNNNQIDIRKNAEDNTIVLLYGVKSDFSAYALFGLLAQVSSGTYDVYIDDVLVGSGITSNTQYDIDFSQIATTYGTATTPETLTLHKIVIKPTTSGEMINLFKCRRTTGVSTVQSQGVLWIHFELTNDINCSQLISQYNICYSQNLYCVSSKGDVLSVITMLSLFFSQFKSKLSKVPKIINKETAGYSPVDSFANTSIKRIILENIYATNQYFVNNGDNNYLEQTIINNLNATGTTTLNNNYKNNSSIKMISDIKSTLVESMQDFLTQATSLYPTKIDYSSKKLLKKIGTYGTSTYPMRGLRGLKVSNEAPFSGGSPQINVNYTGLDRDALVELFNTLPAFMPLTKVGSPTISNGVVSGFTVDDYLKTSLNYATNNMNDHNYEFVVKFTPFSDMSRVTEAYAIKYFSNTVIRGLGVNFGKLSWAIGSNPYGYQETIESTFDIIENTTYWLKGVFQNGIAELYYSLDGQNYDLLGSIDESAQSFVITDAFYIGAFYIDYGTFDGSIDLNRSYIKIDDTKYQFRLPSGTQTTAANPTLSCVAATGNNLTVVGSPTIDENGVASGFTQNSYLFIQAGSVPRLIKNKCKEFFFKIKTPTEWANHSMFIMGYNNSETSSSAILYDCGIAISEDGYLYMNGTQGNIPWIQLNLDTIYYIKLQFIQNKPRLGLSLDNINWEYYDSTIEIPDFYLRSSTIMIGGAIVSSDFSFTGGIIYLSESYVKFDTDNNYLMKGYITDNDKNIALEKNWSLTLS